MRMRAKIGLCAVGVGVAWLTVNLLRKKHMYKKVNTAIDQNKQVTGTTQDIVTEDAFNPVYYKMVSPAKILTVAEARKYVNRIYDDIGYFTDDETDIVKAIKEIGTKAKLSWVSERFIAEKGEHLGKFIATHVDKGDNLSLIYKLVKSMPIK